MTGKTHTLIGICIGLALIPANAPMEQCGLIVGAAVLGALLPDIDHPGSRLSRRIPIIPRVVNWLTDHRGFTHSLLALALIRLVSQFSTVPPVIELALFWGYASHIVADMMTRSGVQLFYPWGRDIHIMPAGARIVTGGGWERLIVIGVGCLALALLWAYLPLHG